MGLTPPPKAKNVKNRKIEKDSYVHGEVIFYLRPVGAKNLEK